MTSKELKDKYFNGEIPQFTNRLNKSEISNHPCFNCLRETEMAVDKGYWKDFPKPLYYWYEMCDAEGKYIRKFIEEYKPKTILEIGCGSGRIINIALSVDYPKKIYGIDKDKKMVSLMSPLFSNHKEVDIINQDIKDFFNNHNDIDLSISAMNTMGNIDNEEIFNKIVDNSKSFIFTSYDKNYYKLRKEIYVSRGHKDFYSEDGTYYFNDCWIKGLKSKSYTKEDLEDICKKTGKKFNIKKISTLLYLTHIYN